MPAPKSRPVRIRDFRKLTPPVGQINALQNSASAQALYKQFRGDTGLLGLQAQQLRADRRLGLEEAGRTGQVTLAESAGAALERGVIGSSVDIQEGQRIRDDTAAQKAGIRSTFTQQMIQNLANRMQARQEYETGILNLLAMKKSQQSTNEINEFFEDLLRQYGEGGGGGGRGGGRDGGGGGRGGGGAGGGGGKDSGGMGFNQRLRNLSSLSPGELHSLQTKITNRMHKRTQRIESQGWNVFHKGDKVWKEMIRNSSQSDPQLLKRLTYLHQRRQRIKQLLTSGKRPS